MNKPAEHIFVIFGASGDLTNRKLIPAIYSLFVQNLLPDKFALLGVSRSDFNDESFRDKVKKSINDYKEIDDLSHADEFLKKIFYISLDPHITEAYKLLSERLSELKVKNEINGNTVFYLSTPPNLYPIIPRNLSSFNLHKEETGWKRVVIEKPFGYDFDSAEQLKNELLKDWKEEQIYRIDHYLGKETVQNLLVTRFSNGFFEPLWNRNFIHHVEITSAESIGVEDRGGYYDSSGALRDMVQNHLLQMVGLVAMEPPSSLEPLAIRNEILKVFQSFRPIKPQEVKNVAIRGQYTESKIKGESLKAYREEKDVDPNSTTETYTAIKFILITGAGAEFPFTSEPGKDCRRVLLKL